MQQPPALGVDQLKLLSRSLCGFIVHDKFERASQLMNGLDSQTRRAIVGTTVHNCTLLQFAIKLHRVKFVRFLLDDCGADVNQRCTKIASVTADTLPPVIAGHARDISEVAATPLVLACYESDFNMVLVRCLVQQALTSTVGMATERPV
jgi:hypothetical protein